MSIPQQDLRALLPRRWLFALALLALCQTACPAYLFSGLGSSTGHEVLSSRPIEADSILTCGGALCDELTVSRDFSQKRKPGIFLALLGAEAAASAILIANTARISRDDKAGRVNPSNDSRYTWNLAAAVAACSATALDGIFALIGSVGDAFSTNIKDERLDQRATVKWRGTKSRIALPDLKSQDGKDILARFSVQKVFDVNGLKPGQAEPYEVKAGTRLVALQFDNKGLKLSEDERRRVKLLVYRTVRTIVQGSKPAALDLMSEEQVTELLSAQGTLDKAACGDQCNIETARQVGADLLLTGTIDSAGSKLQLTLRLEDAKTGRTLSSAQGQGLDDAELNTDARRAAADLMEALK